MEEQGWAEIDELDDVRWALTPLGTDLLAGGSEAMKEMCAADERNLGVVAAK